MTAQTYKSQKGFTLIELLVVIGILAILLAITLIAINPARQFAQANNTKRSSDVNAILNAIGQYQADNHGALPAGMPAAGASAITIGGGTGQADICSALATQYIAQLPVDPLTNNGTPIASTCPANYNTGYQVSVGAGNNRVTVSAPATEIPPGTSVISVTR
jgi:prepilin-type N-terminal cleavage/methylation domain-containing protein